MFEDARERLQQKRNAACLEAYRNDVPSGSPDPARGYYLKALILEYDVEGSGSNLSGAIDCYRMASHLAHNSDEFYLLCIARVMMKREPPRCAAALAYIQRASAAKHTPEVDLAYARYFEVESDLGSAKRFYLKAALKGRVAGFFGLSSVLRKEDRNLQAAIVDGVRLLAGPFLFALLGKKARSSFDGY
jgi:TPR repeat protein